jgi:hypothetical protein
VSTKTGQARLGRRSHPLETYIRGHLAGLTAMPAFLFVAGGHGRLDPSRYLAHLAQRTAWRPTGSGAFKATDPALRWAILDLAYRIADEVPAALAVSMM